MTTPAWLDVVDEARRESATRRPDLATGLQRLRTRLVQPDFRVLAIGTAKQGKSQLINAMVNAPVCPVSDQVSTTVPTLLRHADQPRAELLLAESGPALGLAEDADREPVPADKIAAELIGRMRGGRPGDLVRAEVGLPRPLLATGLVLIDGPDAATLSHAELADLLADVDSVLLVADAGRPLTADELDLFQRAARSCPRIACVRTRTDLSERWREIMQADAAALNGLARGVPTVGVSAALRLHAAATSDEALNKESGFPELITYLQRDLAAQADQAARHAVAQAVISVADQITAVGRAQLLTQPPQDDSAAMQELLAAQRRVEDLRRRVTRWQHALSDGMADIVSDIDHDLRERTREILRSADRTFDKADPLKVWEDFGMWLIENLSAAVLDNFAWAADRCRWLANHLTGYFADFDQGLPPDFDIGVPGAVEDRLAELEKPEIEPVKIGHKIITGLRGSYSGVLMIGMLTSSVFGMISPVSVGAGALLGIKTLREDTEMQLRRRQAAAKTAVQRHVDDVVFHSSKYTRDALRHVQRDLRNHFTDVAEELQALANESINRATMEARAEAVERDRRAREIAGQLERLSQLRRKAQLLVTNTPMIAA